jgi:transposase
VAWATDALDQQRRAAWNHARREQVRTKGKGVTADAREIARYALWKNPEDHTEHQAAKLAWIAKTQPRCTAPTSSKRAYGSSFRSRAKPVNKPWTGG